jgi:hypothetical protein
MTRFLANVEPVVRIHLCGPVPELQRNQFASQQPRRCFRHFLAILACFLRIADGHATCTFN